MDDHQAIQDHLLRSMVARSKTRKRIKKRFPVLTFDRKTLRLLGVRERKWRGRRVPRVAETLQLLLTAYVGLVVRSEPFLSWSRYLRETFPDLMPNQGGANGFLPLELKQRRLLGAYLEGKTSIDDALPRPVIEDFGERRRRDNLGYYDSIVRNSVLNRGPRVSMECRYLCSRCGLHLLATTLFATASYGPRITHKLVWDPDLSWIIGQTELGVFSIPEDSPGHGRAGMWLTTYEQVEAVTGSLFLQQTQHYTPQTLAQQNEDSPLRVKKELQRARQVLGMRRRRGRQSSWMSRVPGKSCTNCRSRIREEALKLSHDGVSAKEIAGRIGARVTTVRSWLSKAQ